MNVTVINSFEVPADQDDAFVATWRASADYLATRPGYVSTRLHKSLMDDASYRFVNVAEWASADDLKAAIFNPEFRPIAAPLATYGGAASFYTPTYEHTA